MRALVAITVAILQACIQASLWGSFWGPFWARLGAPSWARFLPRARIISEPRAFFVKSRVHFWTRNSGPKTGPPRDSTTWLASSRAKSGAEIRVQKWTRNSGLSRGRCCHFRAYLGFGKLGLFRRGRLGPEHRWALSEHAASCLHCPTDYGVLVNCSTHDSLWHTTGG